MNMLTDDEHHHQVGRHPSYYGDLPAAHYFAPQPPSIEGPFVVIGPINGHLSDLYDLWNVLTMEPEFGNCNIVFTGNYLCGEQARDILSFLCTLRLSHPSPIFLSGPHDLAAAAFLGLLPNLELTLALTAVGTAWGDAHHDVFTSYGVASHSSSDLAHALPLDHREFLSSLVVSLEHPSLTLTAMAPSNLSASSLTSTFASDFFALPHPLHSEHPPLVSVASSVGSGAAALSDEQQEAAREQAEIDQKDSRQKTLYVDQSLSFPEITTEGIAMNGSGRLAALFHPSGRVVRLHGNDE